MSDEDSQSDEEPTIDPTFGYPGTSEDEIPESLSPDHTVELHADEEKFLMRDGRPLGARFGVFSFEQAGLHVDPGEDGTPDLGVEPFAPGNIVDEGEVHTGDLSLDIAVPLPEPAPPSQI